MAAPAAQFAKERRQSGVIVTEELPADLAKVLSAFDQNGDGDLDLDEIAEAARQYRQSQKDKKMYKQLALVLACILVAFTAALGGIIFWITDALKDNENADGQMVDRNTQKPVQAGTAAAKANVYEEILAGDMDVVGRATVMYFEDGTSIAKPESFDYYTPAGAEEPKRVLVRAGDKGNVYESGFLLKSVAAPAMDDGSWKTMDLEEVTLEERRALRKCRLGNLMASGSSCYRFMRRANFAWGWL